VFPFHFLLPNPPPGSAFVLGMAVDVRSRVLHVTDKTDCSHVNKDWAVS
jgi:hypothetical protein